MKTSRSFVRDTLPRQRELPFPCLSSFAWRGLAIGQSLLHARQLAEQARRFEIHPPDAQRRVLVLGDSTGVGVGSSSPEQSLPGLLAAEFPQVEIVNASVSGARVADALTQSRAHATPGRCFDLVLVMAGGNDVLKMTPRRALSTQVKALLRELQHEARLVVWLGSADIGTAPALKPPMSRLLGWQCRRTMRLLERLVREYGAEFIDFSTETHSRAFTQQPGRYFAADGVHPSAAAYQHCFQELMHRVPLGSLLAHRPRVE